MHDIVLEHAPVLAMAFAKGRANAPGKLLETLKPSLAPENALRLVGRGRPDEEIRKLVSKHIREHTYQDPGEIEGALRLIALHDLWEPVRGKLRLKNKAHAKEFLVKYVVRRHQIVHEADTYKSKKFHDKLRPISRKYTVNCLKHVTRFVNALDKVIASHMRLTIREQ